MITREFTTQERWLLVLGLFAAVPLVTLLGYVVGLVFGASTIRDWVLFWLWLGGIDVAISLIGAVVLKVFFDKEHQYTRSRRRH